MSEYEELVKWSLRSQSAPRIKAMLELAKHDPRIACEPEDFDRDPYLFNCLTGTVELKTGECREHRSKDMITKLAPVEYDKKAKCPLWLDCLDTWQKSNKHKIDYLQELSGMWLTGDVSNRVFPVFHGGGQNGKSVFCNTMMGIVGDYGTVAPVGFLRRSFFKEHKTEIADLFGRRLIVAQETKPGMKLRVDLIKEMTGERRLKGRFMRKDFFEFDITHHTVLNTNTLPIIDDPSDAIWDRLHLTEWPVRISDSKKIDTHLYDKLKAEWPGILNWRIKGCLKWQDNDCQLKLPGSVKRATKEYRNESDPLKDFTDEKCVIKHLAYVPVAKLYSVYDSWCLTNNRERTQLTPREFNDWLRGKSCVNKQKKIKVNGEWINTKCWIGVGLK